MILSDKQTSWFDMYNKANNTIIVATEMILAHKLFNNTNKTVTVIGIPNNIDKEVLWDIVCSLNASEVYVYFDKYTIMHSIFAYNNTVLFLEQKGIKVYFRIANLSNKIEGNEMEEKVA